MVSRAAVSGTSIHDKQNARPPSSAASIHTTQNDLLVFLTSATRTIEMPPSSGSVIHSPKDTHYFGVHCKTTSSPICTKCANRVACIGGSTASSAQADTILLVSKIRKDRTVVISILQSSDSAAAVEAWLYAPVALCPTLGCCASLARVPAAMLTSTLTLALS